MSRHEQSVSGGRLPTSRATGWGRWARRAVVGALGLSGLLYAWAWEGRSVERANRLQRAGSAAEAARVYRDAIADRARDPGLEYNLGTSLMEIEATAARTELEAATGEAPDGVRARAFYNQGLLELRDALDGAGGDTLRALAEEAVRANRRALVLRPGHPDTKWNLAMAQRLLDSIEAADNRPGRESAESALEADEIVESQTLTDMDEEQELPEDAPRRGEEEARADRGDEDAMTRAEADEILSATHLDPTVIVRKLLALEGRSYFGRRFGPRRPRR